MQSVHGYPIAVLGDVTTSYLNVQHSGGLSESKRHLLANLVAAGSNGLKSTDLATVRPENPQSDEALRMALSRLRDHLPPGAIPDATSGSYHLAVNDNEVDLWALLLHAKSSLAPDVNEADLVHLVTPVDAFRNVHLTELLENASVEIAKAQRDLLDRIAEERPELLRGQLLDRLEAHLGDDPYNERLVICTSVAVARAGDRRRALEILRDGEERLTNAGLTLSGAGARLELELLNAAIEPRIVVDSLRQAYRVPRRLVELGSGPYVDSAGEVKRLHVELGRTGGDAGVFTLVGDSGLGKSRFCAELAQRVAPTTETVYVAPISTEASTAFGPLLTALPQFAEAVAASVASGRDLEKAGIWAIFTTLLSQMASDRSVLLIVDDCQSLDTQSRELIGHLAAGRSIPRLSILLVERQGSDPSSSTSWITTVAPATGSVELSLLDKETMRTFVQLHHPHIDERVLQHLTERMLRSSAGLPGVAALLLPSSDPHSSALPDPESLTPSNALAALIDDLTDNARLVGLVASMIGPNFDLDLLQRVSDLDEAELLVALDELVRRELVRERDIGSFFTGTSLGPIGIPSCTPRDQAR